MVKEKKKNKRLTKNQLTEMLQDLFMRNADKTLSFKQIFKDLRLVTHPAKMLAVEIMEDMAWDDFLSKVSDNSYKLNMKGQVQEGRFIRKSNGKNSFEPDDGGKPVFVAERNSKSALTGDRVRVTFMARRRNHIKEAMVTEILERARDSFVGKLKVERDFAFLVPDGNVFANNIIIPKNKLKGGKTGEKAVVKVTKWPDEDNKNIIGEIVDILGEQGDNDVEMNAILAQYGLPYKYPKRVEEAADKITGEITEQDYNEREDFREVTTFTIDPRDAKDFDDALSIRKLGDKLWEVGVHIADVSHYVTEGSIIDKEAQKRATSIYLVDRTIPMLPERLCNFVCSLRPNEEKLTYSAVFDLDDNAEIKSWRLVHTVIKSNRRFAYEEVQQILEDNGVIDGTGQPAPPAGPEGYKGEYAEELVTLDMLAKKLREARFKNGAVKFDRKEMRFEVDKTGKPVRCYFKKSKDANKLIEEFMLLANRSVAESIGKVKKGQKAKTLPYRIHDAPDPTKLETLREFIVKFGYRLKTAGAQKGRDIAQPQQADGRLQRQARTEPYRVGSAQGDDESQVQRAQHRPLRTGVRVLHPLHQPHTPLSRHNGAPPADTLPERRTQRKQGVLRRTVRALERHGDNSTERRARLHKVQDGGIHGRQDRQQVRRTHKRHNIVRHLLRNRREPLRGNGAHA